MMMFSLPRVLALAGIVLLIVGSFLPTHDTGDGDAPECQLGVLQEALVAVDCFSDDVETGFSVSAFGLVLIVVSLFGTLAALAPTPVRLWTLAVTALAVVGVLFVYQDAYADLTAAGDYGWGWGVLGGAVLLLIAAALVGSIRQTPTVRVQ